VSELDTGDLEELAGLVSFHVGAWQDFGYANPPTPDSKPVPSLGERSANAIKAGHDAVEDIDRLIARLHQVRAQLQTELRQDSDIRAARVDAMLAERTDNTGDSSRWEDPRDTINGETDS
jgi:hypothetical protein